MLIDPLFCDRAQGCGGRVLNRFAILLGEIQRRRRTSRQNHSQQAGQRDTYEAGYLHSVSYPSGGDIALEIVRHVVLLGQVARVSL